MEVIRILVLLLVIGGILFVFFAWAKGWLKGSGMRGSFTSQVIMHNMSDQARQKAMEYVIDEEEEREKKDALSGEDEEPGNEDNKEEDPP